MIDQRKPAGVVASETAVALLERTTHEGGAPITYRPVDVITPEEAQALKVAAGVMIAISGLGAEELAATTQMRMTSSAEMLLTLAGAWDSANGIEEEDNEA